MTVASVNVNIQLAFPQGYTADEVRERVLMLLADALVPEDGVVEFDLSDVQVNADPFGKKHTSGQLQQMLLPQFGNGGPLPLALR